MRSPVPALVVVAILGGAAYLALRPPAGTVPTVRDPGPTTPTAPPPAAVPVAPTPGLAAGGAPPVKAVAGPRVVGGVIRDHGAARLTLTLPDGVDANVAVRLDITPKGPAFAEYPLPVREEDGTWRYAQLPVGAYRVRVVADGLQAADVDVKVRADEETTVPVTLVRGGAIAYKAVLYSGEAPEAVKLALVDGRGVPVDSSIQLPAGMVHVGQDTRALNLDLPAEARIVGLKPGAYRLRATAPSGEFDEQTVDVTLGEPVAVELKIRK